MWKNIYSKMITQVLKCSLYFKNLENTQIIKQNE